MTQADTASCLSDGDGAGARSMFEAVAEINGFIVQQLEGLDETLTGAP
jgi:poly(3-hydroxybutyrate) depolymerase